MEVRNLISEKSGRPVANQYEIIDDNGNRYFQSYQTIIAIISPNGQVYLNDELWNCSRTTTKYRNQFLGENTTQTRAKIESGEYRLAYL
jgi:hypothetical protein